MAPKIIELTPQKKLDSAFENYFKLSEILRDDLMALLESETNSQHWRRNFIRAAAALIEGNAQCLRDMCKVSFECIAPDLARKETEVIRSEQNFAANDRIKLTLRAAYKLFELQPAPNFGGAEWSRAQRILDKRHKLMHPKTPEDLEISDPLWKELRDDVNWLIKQLFNFVADLQIKYDT